MTKINLQFSKAVSDARAAGGPIVALESTIISHGMPYPENLETARAVEECVRDGGATPATIAVLDGVVHIGLEDDQLEQLARASEVRKLSRRDLPHVLATSGTGATTVAATMICADLAGIRIFATGGIGGVHRGAEHNFDISADLEELARTPVAVVCAGAKSILDLPKTLEYLETQGVPVITVGSDQFPAFFTRDSGLAAPARADTVSELTDILRCQSALGYSCGTLITNPIPTAFEASGARIEAATAEALIEAERDGIQGKDVTPYLLSRIVELTEGASLQANIALIKNNARLAAEIAASLAE